MFLFLFDSKWIRIVSYYQNIFYFTYLRNFLASSLSLTNDFQIKEETNQKLKRFQRKSLFFFIFFSYFLPSSSFFFSGARIERSNGLLFGIGLHIIRGISVSGRFGRPDRERTFHIRHTYTRRDERRHIGRGTSQSSGKIELYMRCRLNQRR